MIDAKNPEVVRTLHNDDILDRMEKLLRVAQPIKALLKLSESDRVGPDVIAYEWLKCEYALSLLSATHFGSAAKKKKFMAAFTSYLEMALTDGHYAALLLSPNRDMMVEGKSWLKDKVLQSAISFLTTQGISETWLIEWIAQGELHVADPVAFNEAHAFKGSKHFWLAASVYNATYAPVSRVVNRLMGLISSSSSVERLFSAYGLTWTKLRNRLRSKLVQKMTFIRQRMLIEASQVEAAAADEIEENNGSEDVFVDDQLLVELDNFDIDDSEDEIEGDEEVDDA